MRIKNNIPEASAEMLLNYLYPELEKNWVIHGEGTFYRNYNSDLFAYDEETAEAWTARDTFLNLLPQGMLSLDNDLKGEDAAAKFKKIKRRIQLLNEAFLPIDTNFFRQHLYMERQVSELLQDKLTYVLRTYFNIELDKISSPLVREAALMLPYVSSKRGDFGFVKGLLSSLLHCPVDMMMGRYSPVDSRRFWVPQVRYELLIYDLSPEEYRVKNEELEPLREFIREWLIPFEVRCQMLLKEHYTEQFMNTRLTLNYNVELPND